MAITKSDSTDFRQYYHLGLDYEEDEDEDQGAVTSNLEEAHKQQQQQQNSSRQDDDVRHSSRPADLSSADEPTPPNLAEELVLATIGAKAELPKSVSEDKAVTKDIFINRLCEQDDQDVIDTHTNRVILQPVDLVIRSEPRSGADQTSSVGPEQLWRPSPAAAASTSARRNHLVLQKMRGGLQQTDLDLIHCGNCCSIS